MNNLRSVLRLALLLCFGFGCARAPQPPALVDVGPTQWASGDGCELAVTSVRLGRARMKGMFGSGISKDEILIVTTQFRGTDPSRKFKYMPLQSDGLILGGGGMLKDEAGAEYKAMVAAGFDSLPERAKSETVVDAKSPPVSDVLFFEGKAGNAKELHLEIPSRHLVQTADGKWMFPTQTTKFRFRIPRATWENNDISKQHPWTAVGPDHWASDDGCAVCVTDVRLGKAKVRSLFGTAETTEDLLVISTEFRVADAARKVSYSPWQSGIGLIGRGALLQDKRGTVYLNIGAGGLDSFVGQAKTNTVLTDKTKPARDLLVFEGKAAQADELYLELTGNYQIPDEAKMPEEVWIFPKTTGTYRFRIPRSVWER